MDSMGELIKELESVRDSYDRMIKELERQLARGSNPQVTPDLIADVKRWRVEVNDRLKNYGRGKDA